MDNKVWIVLMTAFMVSILACEDRQVDPITERLGYDYFPLEIGDYKIFEVEEVNFSSQGFDTSRYFLREALEDTFRNGENLLEFRIFRYISEDTSTGSWELDSIWSTRLEPGRAIVRENSIPFIKLVFPFDNKSRWDGNALNGKSTQLYEVEFMDQQDTLLGADTYQNLLKLTISNEADTTEVNQRFEYYSLTHGLIIKDYTVYFPCTTEGECGEDRTIEAGRVIKQKIVRKGNIGNEE